jgi:hypothetical protein
MAGAVGAVRLVGDVAAPPDRAAGLVVLLPGDAGHERFGAAPCEWFSFGSKP